MDRQLTLEINNPQPEDTWNSDDWETPNNIARSIASLVLPTDRRILEPAAGTGQIAKFLPAYPPQVDCFEPNAYRYLLGRGRVSQAHWINTVLEEVRFDEEYDLLVTNPPFSKIQTFVQSGLRFLNPENPTARLLYLLPIDWMCLKSVAEWWGKTDAHIHHCYAIPGRVAYLKNGVAISGRRRNDAVFDIRPGRDGAAISYLEV